MRVRANHTEAKILNNLAYLEWVRLLSGVAAKYSHNLADHHLTAISLCRELDSGVNPGTEGSLYVCTSSRARACLMFVHMYAIRRLRFQL